MIRIDGDRLEYEARTADGQLYDGFTMVQGPDRRRRMVVGQASTMDVRRFENTAPYPGTDGLDD